MQFQGEWIIILRHVIWFFCWTQVIELHGNMDHFMNPSGSTRISNMDPVFVGNRIRYIKQLLIWLFLKNKDMHMASNVSKGRKWLTFDNYIFNAKNYSKQTKQKTLNKVIMHWFKQVSMFGVRLNLFEEMSAYICNKGLFKRFLWSYYYLHVSIQLFWNPHLPLFLHCVKLWLCHLCVWKVNFGSQ